jgi:hypothetical protein
VAEILGQVGRRHCRSVARLGIARGARRRKPKHHNSSINWLRRDQSTLDDEKAKESRGSANHSETRVRWRENCPSFGLRTAGCRQLDDDCGFGFLD